MKYDTQTRFNTCNAFKLQNCHTYAIHCVVTPLFDQICELINCKTLLFFRRSKPPITTLPCWLFLYISQPWLQHIGLCFSHAPLDHAMLLLPHCWLSVKRNGDKRRGLVCSRIHMELSQWSSGKMVEWLPPCQLACLNCFNWALPPSAGIQIGWGLSGVRLWIMKRENVNYEKRECELWKVRLWIMKSEIVNYEKWECELWKARM